MFDDEPAEPRVTARLAPLRLEGRDVTELRRYIAELQAEIERTSLEISRRESVRAAADRVFGRREDSVGSTSP